MVCCEPVFYADVGVCYTGRRKNLFNCSDVVCLPVVIGIFLQRVGKGSYPSQITLAIWAKSYFKHDNSSQEVILLSHRHGFKGQLSWDFIGTTFGLCGISFLSSVGPKKEYVFTPSATAMCNGAESEHTNISAEDMSFAKSTRFFVFP